MIAYEIPDALLARCAGHPMICKKVIDRYVQQMGNDVPKLLQLLESNDAESAAKLAHRIKGASANVVAEELRMLGAEIEQLADEGRTQEALLVANELQVVWPKYEELTAAFLQS